MTTFESDFRAWLARALIKGVPEEVVAFAFNLFEHSKEGSRFGAELIGASSFDPDNTDWACQEVWEPRGCRAISIPEGYSGTMWEECLSRMSNLVSSVLAEDNNVSAHLRSASGVGLGFVDGELVLLSGSPKDR